jgi:hypothetical protein
MEIRHHDKMKYRNVVPPDGYPDNPNEVNEMLLEDSLSLNYWEMRNLKTCVEQKSPAQMQIDDLLSRDLLQLSRRSDHRSAGKSLHDPGRPLRPQCLHRKDALQ